MAVIDLISIEQLKDLQNELRAYDVNWMDRLVTRFEKSYPEEKENYTKSRLYSVFMGKKKNALHVTRVYTEAHAVLQEIKELFAKTLPPTTISAFNNQKPLHQHG